METNKKQKGFTLIELIIVMAVFGLLMLAIMQFIDPVQKTMRKVSITEANSASVDNIKRYLEGSLRYAEAVDVSVGDLKYYDKDGVHIFDNATVGYASDSTAEASRMKAAVKNFISRNYQGRTDENNRPFTGTAYVLKIDNANGGRITESAFTFKSGFDYYKYEDVYTYNEANVLENVGKGWTKSNYDLSGNLKTYAVEPEITQSYLNNEVINDIYYDGYSFYISPGLTEVTPTEGEDLGLAKRDTGLYYGLLNPDTTGITFGGTSNQMFSFTITTYKTSTPMVYAKKQNVSGTFTDEDDYTKPVFQSPYAVSNASAALVNINSGFINKTYYGAKHYSGTGFIPDPNDSNNMKDNLITYPSYSSNPFNDDNFTDKYKVDCTDGKSVNVTDGKWDYEELTAKPTCTVIDGDNTVIDTASATNNCIYVIYTLPDQSYPD